MAGVSGVSGATWWASHTFSKIVFGFGPSAIYGVPMPVVQGACRPAPPAKPSGPHPCSAGPCAVLAASRLRAAAPQPGGGGAPPPPPPPPLPPPPPPPP